MNTVFTNGYMTFDTIMIIYYLSTYFILFPTSAIINTAVMNIFAYKNLFTSVYFLTKTS